MPYVPLRNGQSVFISDQEQAQQRYQQEWGGGQPQQQAAATPKPQAAPKPAAKPNQSQRGFDLGRFIQQAGGQAVEAVKGAVKSGATNFLAGPLAPFVQLGQQAQELGKVPIPGTQTTIGKETGRVAAEAARKLVNDPIAFGQQKV